MLIRKYQIKTTNSDQTPHPYQEVGDRMTQNG